MATDDFVIRAFELPLHHAGKETWELIRECWRHARQLANWCQTEMLRQDDPAAPRPPDFDLYARAFGRLAEKRGRKDATKVLLAREAGFPARDFFAGARQSASTIIEDVQADYRQHRHDVFVRHSRTIINYRNYPWPVHGQQVKAAWLDEGNGRPHLRITLPGGQVELRMRNGAEFGRQMAHFRTLVARHGAGVPFKQIVLREKKCRGGDVMIKMVAELPVRQRTGDRVLVLATDPEAFWVAEIDRRRAWVLNNDHWRRVVARHQEHLRILQRMSEDAKAERRMGNNLAGRQQARLDVLCQKDRDRLASFTHEAASHLAQFAARQGVGCVLYLDRERGYVPRFPWHELHAKLAQKLEELGIAFHAESDAKSKASQANVFDEEMEAEIRPTTQTEDERWTRACELRERSNLKLATAMTRGTSHPAVSGACATLPT